MSARQEQGFSIEKLLWDIYCAARTLSSARRACDDPILAMLHAAWARVFVGSDESPSSASTNADPTGAVVLAFTGRGRRP